ncbi:WXG100 family type VII secretion target [Nonomuraea sp. CA-218870]|uniref:WXG100 family type VII secretion target n=1 Tax=Nonomuraea sp. CA-218870 TaxID=3239998 RepID=UPI003D8CF44A
MALYGASPAQLQTAAGHCEKTAQQIEAMRQRVEQIKGDLTTQGWKGGAAQRFAQALTAWDGEFKQVIKILEDIYDRLNMGAGVYRNAAEQNMDIAGNFTGGGQGGRIDSLINTR